MILPFLNHTFLWIKANTYSCDVGLLFEFKISVYTKGLFNQAIVNRDTLCEYIFKYTNKMLVWVMSSLLFLHFPMKRALLGMEVHMLNKFNYILRSFILMYFNLILYYNSRGSTANVCYLTFGFFFLS